MPSWFLLLNGAALLTMGVVLLPMRLRERPLYRHFFGIVWAVLCCLVGIALLAMGQGYLDVPGGGKSPAGRQVGPTGVRGPDFPSGR